MTKQEEIREGLYKELIAQAPTEEVYGKVDRILGYLHSQGVVMKVDREYPLSPYGKPFDDYQQGFNQALKAMAGYVAVEPLIKEVKDG